MSDDPFYFIDIDPKQVAREREKARQLKKSSWWQNILSQGKCHYCEEKFKRTELTMDHVVPVARGGKSTKGNVVPSCRPCNQKKKLETPAEAILDQLNTGQGSASEEDEG